jgi:hypothetical protein
MMNRDLLTLYMLWLTAVLIATVFSMPGFWLDTTLQTGFPLFGLFLWVYVFTLASDRTHKRQK